MNATIFAVSAAVFVVLSSIVFLVVAGRKWGLPLAKAALEAYWEGRWSGFDERLTEVEHDLETLPRIWEEFAVDARKRQARARYHVRRVKEELTKNGLSDDEINALERDLRSGDGEGGYGSQLSLLPEDVEKVPETAQEDPMTAILRRKWGSA